MATISFNDVVAGLKKGSTWGTAGDITASGINLYASQISISGGFADFLTRDFGQGGKRTNNARLQADFNVTITADLTYGQAWLALLAGLYGTESSPSETTGGQGDYSCHHDVADSTYGIYWTLCFSIESDRVLEIPSLKVVGMTIQQDINQAGTVTFQCVASNVQLSSTNTVAEITALSDLAYETCTLGGANHYFRIDSYSASTALTNADDKTILGYTFSMTRPHSPIRGLRGSNTAYTMEPKQLGPIEATLTVRYNELDDGTWDILSEWLSPSFKMATLFVDGSQIGSGVNRSITMHFPYLKPKGQFPAGHDVQSNNGLFTPTIQYDALKAASNAAGMSASDICRVTTISQRSTKWTA